MLHNAFICCVQTVYLTTVFTHHTLLFKTWHIWTACTVHSSSVLQIASEIYQGYQTLQGL